MSQAADPAAMSDDQLAKFIAGASDDELLELIEGKVATAPDEELFGLLERVVATATLEQLFVLLSGLVDTASDAQLRALADSQLRGRVLDEIFERMVHQFRSDRARGLDAVVHWKIFDRPGGGYDHYELVIEDGSCRLSERPWRQARVTFRIKPVDFLKLVTGNAGGTGLALRGRLQVLGDINFARKVNGLFQLPEA